MDIHKVTTKSILEKKQQKIPITMLTAYDFPTAQMMDEVGIDIILVGDSLGMTVLGYETTLPVTMEDMLHHCKAVSRGTKNSLLVGDMPFMSYQASVEEGVRNAGRFLQESGMDAVKLEGGLERIEVIRKIVECGIPVIGHIGLTPQSVHQLGGFRTQGKTANAALKLLRDAIALEQAGIFALVLESIPEKLGRLISERLLIPTIGIGAGGGCDGQVLVIHDVLGYYDQFKPRFAKQYANVRKVMVDAITAYKQEVISGAFPSNDHVFPINDQEWEKLIHSIDEVE
jgi:3-methyl-2-oxobutanoate hydroxymethyltransferase